MTSSMESDYSITIYRFSTCEHLTIIIIEQAFTRIYLFIYLLVFCFYWKIKFKEGWHNAEDNPGMNYVLRCKRQDGGGRS